MLDTFVIGLTQLTALGCGLMAGVFFAFSVVIMPALTRLPAAQGMAAMQAINTAVLDRLLGLFGLVFLGTGASCLLLGGVALWTWQLPHAPCRLVGSLLYLIGSLAVTIVFNVPRNEALATTAADSVAGPAQWAEFLPGWTAWNHVRALASLAAATVLTSAFC